MPEDTFLPRRRLLLGLCATSLFTSCALDVEGESNLGDAPLAQQAAAPGTLRSPDGSYFADVFANGTGCPAGSWTTQISPDGQVFTTTFSKYEVKLEPTQAASVLDCQITVKLHSPGGLSYSVQSFYYSGYAFLEPGVSGRQTASYYFQGAPVTSRQARTELVGPKDEPYLFSDEVKTADSLIWSPCGADRDLQILTRVRLVNGTPRASGYMNLSALDGSNKLVFRLAWRDCNNNGGPTSGDAGAPEAPPATPDAATPSTPPTTTPDATPPAATPPVPVTPPTPPVTTPPDTATPPDPTPPPVTPPPVTTPPDTATPPPATTPPVTPPPVTPPPVTTPPATTPPATTPPVTTPPVATPPVATPPVTTPPVTTPPVTTPPVTTPPVATPPVATPPVATPPVTTPPVTTPPTTRPPTTRPPTTRPPVTRTPVSPPTVTRTPVGSSQPR